MGFDLLHLFLSLAVLGLLAAFLTRRADAAGRGLEAATAREMAEQRGRALSLLAQDVQSTGLALLGRAQVIGGREGRAFEVEARHLFHLADSAAEAAGVRDQARGLREERFPLAPVLREAVTQAAQQLGPGVRQWRIHPEIEQVTLRADRRALRTALLQVLTRAARATGEGDSIDVRLERARDAIALVVEDEGLGLAAEDLAPATHDGSEARSRGFGLGLGLVVARSLLRAHGGELVVEAAPGVGARAFLSLPADRLVAA